MAIETYSKEKTQMIALLYIFLAGLFSAISELSNHGKINHWGKWFSQDAWNNKNTWKPYPLWRFWPFIILTDAFHLFKTLFLVAFCLSASLCQLEWYYLFIGYSASFSVFYSTLPYISWK